MTRARIGARIGVSAVLVLLAVYRADADVALETVDRFVPHTSTVAANGGQRVALFLREKRSEKLAAAASGGASVEGRVVLFVHGVSVPSIPDFDLAFEDYSWMAYLAAAGFDSFAMDQTGYGFSPQPEMSDPCNLAESDRAALDPAVFTQRCSRDRGMLLTSSVTDWDEIDTVVDYIRALRGVERVSLLGWSLGGLRAGGYAARHPEKIDKLVLFAPFYQRNSQSEPPSPYPAAGAPMTLQTRSALMNDRWGSNVACEHQVAPGIQERVWQTIMSYDPLGSVWAPPAGVMRVRSASYFGWNAESAANLETPTLIMIGRQDGLLPGAEALYEDIGARTIRCSCAWIVRRISRYGRPRSTSSCTRRRRSGSCTAASAARAPGPSRSLTGAVPSAEALPASGTGHHRAVERARCRSGGLDAATLPATGRSGRRTGERPERADRRRRGEERT